MAFENLGIFRFYITMRTTYSSFLKKRVQL
jgi:hypothetical protein